jgi:NADH-quinone oxidoreductase subunit C
VTDLLREVPAPDWQEAALAARAEGFGFFDVLTGVDLEQDGFEVLLRLWDLPGRRGLQLRTRVPRDEPVVPTVVPVFAGAAWHERATAELLGIRFEGHVTRPLLLPEGFDGHPLRKDFVLASRARPWPGVKEPGESAAEAATRRRRPVPPGAPPEGWTRD